MNQQCIKPRNVLPYTDLKNSSEKYQLHTYLGIIMNNINSNFIGKQ